MQNIAVMKCTFDVACEMPALVLGVFSTNTGDTVRFSFSVFQLLIEL